MHAQVVLTLALIPAGSGAIVEGASEFAPVIATGGVEPTAGGDDQAVVAATAASAALAAEDGSRTGSGPGGDT